MNAQFTNIELSRLNALIERSIDSHNPTIDLGLYFEICDLINNREDNAKEAFKAIKRELNIYKGKNWFVVLKILALLEVCANNCSKKFQINLTNKEFLAELKLMLSPKLQPPIEIQEKILFLIQYWSNMFKVDSDFKPIESLYVELRGKGVDFPINNPDVASLANQLNAKNVAQAVQTRAPAAMQLPDVQRLNLQDNHAHPPHQQQHNPAPAISVVKLNEEQTAKLNSELDVVETNVHILNEILNEFQSTPKVDESRADDLNLLQDLVKTCREMQKRITQLIGSISNENIINELLRINDDLNNSFLRYERFERSLNLQKKSSPGLVEPSAAASSVAVKDVEEKPLIDFDDVDPKLIRSNLENSKKSPPVGGPNQLQATGGNSKDTQNSSDKTAIDDENEIKEMENWLRLQGANENYQNENEASQKL